MTNFNGIVGLAARSRGCIKSCIMQLGLCLLMNTEPLYNAHLFSWFSPLLWPQSVRMIDNWYKWVILSYTDVYTKDEQIIIHHYKYVYIVHLYSSYIRSQNIYCVLKDFKLPILSYCRYDLGSTQIALLAKLLPKLSRNLKLLTFPLYRTIYSFKTPPSDLPGDGPLEWLVNALCLHPLRKDSVSIDLYILRLQEKSDSLIQQNGLSCSAEATIKVRPLAASHVLVHGHVQFP